MAGRSVGAAVAPIARQLADAFAGEPEPFSADRYHPSSAGSLLAALLGGTLVALRARRHRAQNHATVLIEPVHLDQRGPDG